MDLTRMLLREVCPDGSQPVYDGATGLVIACNSNSFGFGDAIGSFDMDGINPSSTPLDYANYESGQVDAFEEAQIIFGDKYEELKSSIPNIWNYLLVFALIFLLAVIVFSMTKNKNKDEPNNKFSG